MTLDPLKLLPTVRRYCTILSLSLVHLHSCKPCTPRGGAKWYSADPYRAGNHTATVDHSTVDPCPFNADDTRTNRRYERCAVRGPKIRYGRPAHPLCNLQRCMPACKTHWRTGFSLLGCESFGFFFPSHNHPLSPWLSSDPTLPQPTTHCPSLPPLLTTTIFSWQIFRSPLFSRRFPSLDLTSKTAAR